ncbi:transcription antitermination factor NusB [Mechercharimyces sp. CAU 1602]|uniref:transcription antitermination factor NusB n=1 Tax=Mechercharimyces sp. CAU 1602 TaxID=2973933 RepID=UPI002162E98B|nr:transcription antitermination factor NusB [Mechercharimyces sp. CAU 1602]MCS1350784.1 transcription antitermination factor NusB [Mechercharimyces sp. CAU 1602]
MSKKSKRRVMREKVVQTLYQLSFSPEKEEAEEVIAAQMNRLKEEDEEHRSFFLRLVRGVKAEEVQLDETLARYLKKGWSPNRLAKVDHRILQLAIYEIQFEEEIPPKVTVDEAVELAKTFSTEESSRFINGVLGNLVREAVQE